MNKPKILTEPSYTFSQYATLPYRTADILADLGYTFERSRQPLQIPRSSTPHAIDELKRILDRNLRRISAVTETSKREAIIAPILVEVCEAVDSSLDIEYPINAGPLLKGTLDYLIDKNRQLLVTEAKQADLDKGFTQLAVELIALDLWREPEGESLFGAVTTGESWRFGRYDRALKRVVQDSVLYRVPEGLETLVQLLVGILEAA
ncbi:hypothetical protein NC981_23330 [Leptolyngbya sp. DQ-M1]|uniref:hypothetical protein n=1 Tax=Leptolyngbya sp. DQ-M1 TaxID=2933920 RepID=UPI00329929E5